MRVYEGEAQDLQPCVKNNRKEGDTEDVEELEEAEEPHSGSRKGEEVWSYHAIT